MSTRNVLSRRSANKLLARMDDEDFERLQLHLRRVRPGAGAIVTRHGSAPELHFPGDGIYVTSFTMTNGQTAAVAMIGSEGVFGLSAFGGDTGPAMTTVALMAERDAYAIDADVFAHEMERLESLSDVIRRYTQAFGLTLMQSVSCNAVHSVEQRCARCLLEVRDRVGRNDLELTHDTLADLLGVRRETITVCAGVLERERLIERGHGRLRITNGPGLKGASCECYAAIKETFERLLP